MKHGCLRTSLNGHQIIEYSLLLQCGCNKLRGNWQWKNECVLMHGKGRRDGEVGEEDNSALNVSFKDRQVQGMDRERPLFNNNINAPSFKRHRIHIPLHRCRPRCCDWKTHLFPQVHKVTGHLFPLPIPKYCELPYLNKRTQPQPPKKKKNCVKGPKLGMGKTRGNSKDL